jgi:signal peptidase I
VTTALLTPALLTPATLATDAPTGTRLAQQLTRVTRPSAASWKRAAGWAYRATVRLLVTLAVLAFTVLAVGPHVLDYRTMTMLTGSMSPVIDPGDVTIVTPIPVQDVATGMIIAYHIPIDDHHLVSHRVVSVEHGTDGSVMVQTRGDANDAADPWQAILQGDTAYQVRAVIPDLGHAIQALRTPVISQALVYGAPTLLAGWLLLTIWRPTTPTTADTRVDEEDQP